MIIENLISFLYTCVDFATTDMTIKPSISCRKLPRNRLGRIPNRVHRLGALYKSFAGTGDCACCSYKKQKKKKRTFWKPCGNYREKRTKKKKKKSEPAVYQDGNCRAKPYFLLGWVWNSL